MHNRRLGGRLQRVAEIRELQLRIVQMKAASARKELDQLQNQVVDTERDAKQAMNGWRQALNSGSYDPALAKTWAGWVQKLDGQLHTYGMQVIAAEKVVGDALKNLHEADGRVRSTEKLITAVRKKDRRRIEEKLLAVTEDRTALIG